MQLASYHFISHPRQSTQSTARKWWKKQTVALIPLPLSLPYFRSEITSLHFTTLRYTALQNTIIMLYFCLFRFIFMSFYFTLLCFDLLCWFIYFHHQQHVAWKNNLHNILILRGIIITLILLTAYFAFLIFYFYFCSIIVCIVPIDKCLTIDN